MKKLFSLIALALLVTSCFPENEGPETQTVFGEVTHTLDLDYSDLPSGQNISRTDILTLDDFIQVTTDDFDAPTGSAIIAPQLIGLYYDIRGIQSGNSFGIIEITFDAIEIGGFSQSLTDFTIIDAENTITQDTDGNDVLEKIRIFDLENFGNMNSGGLSFLTQTMARGRIGLRTNILARDIDLVTSGEEFEIVLTFELAGSIEAR